MANTPKIILYLLTSLFCKHVTAQSITGVWRGYFTVTNASGQNNKAEVTQYNYEIQVLEKVGGQLSGVTYSYKTKEYFGKTNFVGSISANRKNVIISESAMLAVEKKDKTDDCVMICTLQYSKVGTNEEVLKGTFTSKNVKTNSSCFSGEVVLKRVAKSVFPLEQFLKRVPVADNLKTASQKVNNTGSLVNSPSAPKKKYLLELPEQALAKQPISIQDEPRKTPIELLQRENIVLASVLQPEQEVTVFIYDNGIVDNDIVSVLVDSVKVYSGVQLSEKALTFTLHFSEKITQHQIVTIAENLGDILPNTGLLVIKAGKRMIEVPIMSDFKKNAKIIINYKAACKIAVERYN
ncbi:MAG: hypothetical protein WCH59_04865 [Chitinophagia bacterium]|jgi:hypothetical protein